MKKLFFITLFACLFIAVCGFNGCGENKTSDDVQQQQQETILAEGTSAVPMPAIKNFRMKRILKDIIELCDQNGLVTYTYLENEIPHITPGVTAKGGKLTYFGVTIGYGIPYATQFTSPMKVKNPYSTIYISMPQADPDGLFKPANAEGTWVMMKNPNGKEVLPIYIEPRIVVSPFELPLDK